MRAWEVVADPSALVARNAGFMYRPIGASGEAYPEWVRALKGKAGVYVIRDIETPRDRLRRLVSAGRLYDTLTRHFQTWRRWKGFWKGQYGEGHDPGLTYDRDSVEVAVRLTSPSEVARRRDAPDRAAQASRQPDRPARRRRRSVPF